jgi:hypothetical protein
MKWEHLQNLPAQAYTCGYCHRLVSSSVGYFTSNHHRIYICSHCKSPSYFDREDKQIPGVCAGNEVKHLPEDINSLYREARDCVAVGSFTASVLTCRKLLMNIAVAQGAKEGQSFLSYVEYLSDKNYVPPNGKHWVDHIRSKGNEANHEIKLMSKPDAEELISFLEMLLKFIYEFPNKVPKPAPKSH